jgi:hypothetical protein
MRYMGLASLVVLVMLLIRLPEEEQKLIARFGDECRAYVEAHRAAVGAHRARSDRDRDSRPNPSVKARS